MATIYQIFEFDFNGVDFVAKGNPEITLDTELENLSGLKEPVSCIPIVKDGNTVAVHVIFRILPEGE